MTIDNLKLFLMKREGVTPIKIRNYLILHLFHLKSTHTQKENSRYAILPLNQCQKAKENISNSFGIRYY